MPVPPPPDPTPVLGAVQVVPPRACGARGLHLDPACAPAGLAAAEKQPKIEQPVGSADLRENQASAKPGAVQAAV